MARTKEQSISGQNHLFITPPHGREDQPFIRTWQDIESSPENMLEALVGDSVGPHVQISTRAEKLISAMNALAHHNKLVGFDEAVLDPRYKRPIWKRYLDGTPIVIDRSQHKSEQLLDETLRDFLHSTGFTALRGSGLVTRGQVRTKTQRYWRDFTHKVGSPRAHKDLVKLRQNQRRFLADDHPYQSVEGWRRERIIRNTPAASIHRSTPSVPKEETSVTRDTSDSALPERTPEVDTLHKRHSHEILDRIDRQMETRRQTEIGHRNAVMERAHRALEDTGD